MQSERIILSGLWVATMLTYLLGDVLRIYAGDFVAGEINGQPVAKSMWLLVAVIMLVPIVMLVLTLVLPFPAVRSVSIGAAVAAIAFNVIGLPYPGAYDNFLIAVSLAWCAAIVWVAWAWQG
jgi:hypothetical protein